MKARRKPVKRASKKVIAKRAPAKETSRFSGISKKFIKIDRMKIVIKNLILFAILCILSVVIWGVSENELIDQLFLILAILTGVVFAAFLIILLIFLFLGRKKTSSL